ncbi:unnamed protein product [Phytophthora lilii]|uniref:Unnamed protein product n=1 Tax=Phytophthora lilii TaxID=2077276 RepID=A0A9W6WS75_9STRA|nr:unnamed protein product [Phytophthora lilii]
MYAIIVGAKSKWPFSSNVLFPVVQKAPTPEGVGPGSYDMTKKPMGIVTDPPPRQQGWGGRPDSRSMDSAGEWKHTSEIPSVTKFSFRKARASTWIEQVEQRQRREDPLARRKPEFYAIVAPEQRLPHFLQGTSNPVPSSAAAVSSSAAPNSAPGRIQPLVVSLYPQPDDIDSFGGPCA